MTDRGKPVFDFAWSSGHQVISRLAAGEAVLVEQPDGRWQITALNNRSYGYMPDDERCEEPETMQP